MLDPTAPLLLSCIEAAALARVSTRTIRRWRDTGRLPTGKTHPGRTGRVRIRRADLLQLIGLTDEAAR